MRRPLALVLSALITAGSLALPPAGALARSAVGAPVPAGAPVGAGVLSAQAAATVVVRGKLPGHAGMVVLAVSRAGTAKGVRLGAGGAFSFRLAKAAARGTSLQLVDSAGRYAGPVVLVAKARKAYTALGGRSVDLGTLAVRRGYARVQKKLSKGAVYTKRPARADSQGRPLGAGRLGLIRVAGAKATAAGAKATAGAPGDDQDADGLPNMFDADDNGNGTLDTVDPASATSNAGLYSILSAPFAQALNANVAGVTQAQIDDLLASDHAFVLGFYYDEHYTGGRAVSSANVDCYTLVYCARTTGTGVMIGTALADTRWATYSPDGSGLPNLDETGPGRWQMGVEPRVTTAGIHPGDAMSVNFRLAAGGTVSVPTSLAAYFVTTPAIKRWATTAGATEVTYPVVDAAAGQFTTPDGRVTLTAWRPQRMGIPGTGEPAFVDMGRLHWGVSVGVMGRPELGCGGHFSGLSGTLRNEYDPAKPDGSRSLFPLHDLAGDAAPGSGRTVTFTVDVAACLSAAGVDPAGRNVYLKVAAATEGRPGGMDRAAQEFRLQLP